MSEVLVLVPRSVAAPQLPEGALLVPFQTCVDAVVSLRATSAPCVLVTDGLDTEDLDKLAACTRCSESTSRRSGLRLEIGQHRAWKCVRRRGTAKPIRRSPGCAEG